MKLSIIVPVYNMAADGKLEFCLNSLINQTITDYEILAVDDCSTDNSLEILRSYEKKHPEKFKVIASPVNKKQGGAKNLGLAKASGEWIGFIDSDDWVDEKAFKRLIHTLKNTTADLVYSNFYWVDNQTGNCRAEFRHPLKNVEYGKIYHFSEIADQAYFKMHGFTILTDIVKKIPLIDEHCFYVDVEYVLFPVKDIRTVLFIDEFVYQYRIGLPGQSMDISKMQRNAENFDRVMKRVLAYYDEMERLGVEEYCLIYAKNLIARLLASRMKIFLSYPCSHQIKKEMMNYDRTIKTTHPQIYRSVIQPAVIWMRRTCYLAYYPARILYYWKERYSNARK